jgi:peptidoglycan hydrolase-like protein with peptidoglycan-binding domain
MKKVVLMGVALCAMSWLASAITPTPAKKKSAKKGTHAAAGAVRKPAKSTTAKSTAAKTIPKSRSIAGKTAKGKKTVRRASAPRQLAPTKERYQQIQQALAAKGYFSGEPNGVWGQDSTEALKRFQADQNLTPDGKLTSLSLIALGLGPKRLSAQSATEPAHLDQQQ